MFHLFKKVIPRSWRDQFRRIVIDSSETIKQNQRIDQLEIQINNLATHVENVHGLAASTANNLESVGNALIELDAKHKIRMAESEAHWDLIATSSNILKDEFIKISHENT